MLSRSNVLHPAKHNVIQYIVGPHESEVKSKKNADKSHKEEKKGKLERFDDSTSKLLKLYVFNTRKIILNQT